MIIQLLHSSQWCYKKHINFMGRFFEKCISFFCGADISGKARIDKHVLLPHRGIGVIIHPDAEIGEGCIISAKATIGNAWPHPGAPKLGKHVYVGTGAFVGGGISIADYVVIGAGSVLTKDVKEEGAIVAGVPARIIRYINESEKKEMSSW